MITVELYLDWLENVSCKCILYYAGFHSLIHSFIACLSNWHIWTCPFSWHIPQHKRQWCAHWVELFLCVCWVNVLCQKAQLARPEWDCSCLNSWPNGESPRLKCTQNGSFARQDSLFYSNLKKRNCIKHITASS